MGGTAGEPPAGGTDLQPPEAEAKNLARIEADLEAARDLLVDGQRQAALDRCMEILNRETLPITSACTLSVLMRDLGQVQAAEHIRSIVLDGLRRAEPSAAQTPDALLHRAELYSDLEAFDDAEALCRRVVETAPEDIRGVNALASFLTFRNRPGEARAAAEAFCDRNGEVFETFIYFVTIFGHLNARDTVLHFLDRADRCCETATQRARLDYLRAANGLDVDRLDQPGMAVAVFDSFADSYDARLSRIENNGPSLVLTALRELGLARIQTRRVLDAGCGTGLCAGFLRDYAREIVGVDLSVKMLEAAQVKKLYDGLARTDLSAPETYPEGRFDLIVCADVLVYFGALDRVLANFDRVLTPGGWLLLTVETEAETEDGPGFTLYPSGRYKHSDRYLLDTLAKAGFPEPALLEHARLRNEMSRPVLGTALAVQKPETAPT